MYFIKRVDLSFAWDTSCSSILQESLQPSAGLATSLGVSDTPPSLIMTANLAPAQSGVTGGTAAVAPWVSGRPPALLQPGVLVFCKGVSSAGLGADGAPRSVCCSPAPLVPLRAWSLCPGASARAAEEGSLRLLAVPTEARGGAKNEKTARGRQTSVADKNPVHVYAGGQQDKECMCRADTVTYHVTLVMDGTSGTPLNDDAATVMAALQQGACRHASCAETT